MFSLTELAEALKFNIALNLTALASVFWEGERMVTSGRSFGFKNKCQLHTQPASRMGARKGRGEKSETSDFPSNAIAFHSA